MSGDTHEFDGVGLPVKFCLEHHAVNIVIAFLDQELRFELDALKVLCEGLQLWALTLRKGQETSHGLL